MCSVISSQSLQKYYRNNRLYGSTLIQLGYFVFHCCVVKAALNELIFMEFLFTLTV